MKRDNAASTSDVSSGKTTRLFTVESANRSLVFVRKVVQDIVTNYARLMKLRAEREELAAASAGSTRLDELAREIEELADALRALNDELTDVGCELKDWASGLVDFPAIHEGRQVWLCWKLGEPKVEHWHELYSGFSGRKPVGPNFGSLTS